MRFLFSIGIILGLSMAIEVAMVPLAKTKAAEEPGLVVHGMPTAANHLRGFLCDICIDFGAIVKQAYESMETEAEVAQLMKVIFCDRLGDSQSLCNMWIDSYVPVVMRMLANNANSRQICISTKFCPATVTAAKGQRHRLMQLTILKRANAKPLLGSNRCTWGPSYWCSHVGTMKECRSGSYCSRMWQRGPAVPSSSEDCGFCRLLASDLERLARANRTSGESRRLATSACGLVPERRLRSLCLAVVDNYIDEAIQLLRDGLTTDRLCSALSLCGGRRDPKLHVAMATTSQTAVAGRLRTSFCDYCIELAGIARQLFMDKEAETEVAQLFKDSFCPILSFMQSVCNMWIDSYVPEIMRHLANRTSPRQFCINSEICPAAVPAEQQLQQKFMHHVTNESSLAVALMAAATVLAGRGRMPIIAMATLAKLPNRVGESLCGYCVEILTEAKRIIVDRAFIAVLTPHAKVCCSALTHLKDSCEHWMDNYYPDVVVMLGTAIDPIVWCTNASLCKPTEAVAYSHGISNPRIKQQDSRASDGLCEFCKLVLKEARDELSDKKTQAEILQYIKDQVCAIVPEDKDKCDHAVDTYGPIIIQLLVSQLDPASICQFLLLCPNATAAGTDGSAGVSTEFTFDVLCKLCQVEMDFIQNAVRTNPAVRDYWQAAIESWCTWVPAPNRTACHDFLHKYAIEVTLDIDPYRLCQLGSYCPNPSAKLIPPASGGGGPRFEALAPLRYHGNGESPVAPFGRRAEEPVL